MELSSCRMSPSLSKGAAKTPDQHKTRGRAAKTATKLDLSQNQILAFLSEQECDRLLPYFEYLYLDAQKVLCRADEPLRYAYFPQDSVISIVSEMAEGVTVEVGLVGYEGVVGLNGLLGAITYQNMTIVQVPGGCLRIKKEILQAEFDRDKGFRILVHRYTRYMLAQVTQTAACNRVHRLDRRMCRWLLMCHNRAKRNQFPITHEFLANMLGTARSEVTLAAGNLRKAGLIKYGRGEITILDRKGLESAACECYKIVDDELTNPR